MFTAILKGPEVTGATESGCKIMLRFDGAFSGQLRKTDVT